jgi:chromosomal replication initiator protein
VVIGDERFAEQVLKNRRPSIASERLYTLTDMEKAVCQVTRIDRDDLARPQRTPAVNRARELFMYLARRHTDASLRELALRVRDISTVSHGEKRVTKSLQDNSPAAKELNRTLKKTYSLIQACP